MTNQRIEEACKWCYNGTWNVVTRWFLVPESPPTLPQFSDVPNKSFRPSLGYLEYLKFFFWIGLFSIDIVLTIGWLAILVAFPIVGILIAPIAFVVIVLPDIIAYIAIHLRFDTTWYVVSDRSLRIRRGIWIIQETTVTFDNIQNVSIAQGPMQRWFGISDLVIETAGGGGHVSKESAAFAGFHRAVFEGIDNAKELQNLISERVRNSKGAGLGDEHPHVNQYPAAAPAPSIWSEEHLQVLAEIQQAAGKLASRTAA